MANLSIQEQMLKAGLVNQKKLKKAKKGSKKSRDLAKDIKASVQTNKEQQLEKTKSLNQAAKQEQRQKEIKAQVKQLIQMNKLTMSGADIKYNFTDNNVIHYIYVTTAIRQQLLDGILAVAAFEESYVIIPSIVANKILMRDDTTIIDIKEPEQELIDEDDPYADYVVPDDLMW